MTAITPGITAFDDPRVLRESGWIAVYRTTGKVLKAAGVRYSCEDLTRWIHAERPLISLSKFEFVRVRLRRPFDWLKNLWNCEFPRVWYTFKYQGDEGIVDGAPIFEGSFWAHDCFRRRYGGCKFRPPVVVGKLVETETKEMT